MTRINVIPVTQLHNKHLLAEYRELPRVFGAAKKWHGRGGRVEDLPTTYRMGKGHVLFFYSHLLFCFNRQFELYGECLNRNFNVKYNPQDGRRGFLDAPEHLFNDYTPTPDARQANWARLNERMPDFYGAMAAC